MPEPILEDPISRATFREEARTCDECDWEGHPEIMIDGSYEVWTCESCGTDHDDEHINEPDPDDYNDAMREMSWDD